MGRFCIYGYLGPIDFLLLCLGLWISLEESFLHSAGLEQILTVLGDFWNKIFSVFCSTMGWEDRFCLPACLWVEFTGSCLEPDYILGACLP